MDIVLKYWHVNITPKLMEKRIFLLLMDKYYYNMYSIMTK